MEVVENKMDINIYGVSAVVLTGILVEIAKKAEVPTKWLPLASIILGAFVVCIGTWTLSVQTIITGIMIGAITSGTYDFVDKGIDIAKRK